MRRTPRQQRARATVEFLLEAAAQVFEREGLAATTNRIAERAGVSIGTLYQYFPHKQALLDRLVARHVADARARLDVLSVALRADPPAVDDAVRRLAEAAVDLHADRPALHALFERFATRTPAGIAAVEELREAWVAEGAHHLARGAGRDEPTDEHRTRARTIVHDVDAQLHRVPAPYAVQRERVFALVGALVR